MSVMLSNNGEENDWIERNLCRQERMSGTILNSVIVSQELGDPFVLGWCVDALVEHVLEWLVIGEDGELMPKQVWSPFFHCKKYCEHFFFIC